MVGTSPKLAKYIAGVLTVCAVQGLIDRIFPPAGHGHGHHDDHDDGHDQEEDGAAEDGEAKYGGAYTAKVA